MMKKATDEQLKEALATMTVTQTAAHFGMNERTVWSRKAKLTGLAQSPARPVAQASAKTIDATNSKTFVITAAVNATKAHAGFMKTLQLYCALRGAQLIVIPMRYRNPTSRNEDGTDEWWDDRLVPYLTHERTRIAKSLVVLADIKIQPTAISPLQGWLTVSGTDSAILGHTKIALKSVASKMGSPAKLVMTTGACTVENYSDTNAGAKGQFHHTLGACVVEVSGDHAHTRQICPLKDGSFIDLATKYTAKGVEPAPRAEALTMGDIHAEVAERRVLKATAELATMLKPKTIVAHDVLNFGSASHHSKYFEKFERQMRGTSSVLKELQATAKVLDEISGLADQVVMVNSNHHDHFKQWLEKAEHANDLENALVYHETKTVMLQAIHDGGYIDPFQHWMGKLMRQGNLRWLKPAESFSRFGIEYSFHGHKGPNGARGSTKGFANIGAKVVKGHSHGAEIVDGARSVGTTSKMNMGYNADSPSGWTWTHDITYANGKQTLIHCIGGSFFRNDQAEGAA
jgi:hypothetical protein